MGFRICAAWGSVHPTHMPSLIRKFTGVLLHNQPFDVIIEASDYDITQFIMTQKTRMVLSHRLTDVEALNRSLGYWE